MHVMGTQSAVRSALQEQGCAVNLECSPAVLKLKVRNGSLPCAAAEEAARAAAPVPGVLLGAPHVKSPAMLFAT